MAKQSYMKFKEGDVLVINTRHDLTLPKVIRIGTVRKDDVYLVQVIIPEAEVETTITSPYQVKLMHMTVVHKWYSTAPLAEILYWKAS